MSGLSPKIIEEDVGEVWMGQVWRQADERGEGNEYTGNHYTIIIFQIFTTILLKFYFRLLPYTNFLACARIFLKIKWRISNMQKYKQKIV